MSSSELEKESCSKRYKSSSSEESIDVLSEGGGGMEEGETKVDELISVIKQLNQHHIFDLIPNFNKNHAIYKQLASMDLKRSLDRFKKASSGNSAAHSVGDITPAPSVDWIHTPLEEKNRISAIGLEAIKRSSVAAVILSGGQGTRLGFAGPKGMYSIRMPSGKSIFQIHIEKLMKVRSLAAKEDKILSSIPVYIMTSDLNDQCIRNYFKENHYFGYPESDIYFFEQKLELCLSNNGDIIVESEKTLSLAPDGNGAIYTALQDSGAMDDIIRRGVQHLHIYGIDNVLIQSADPAFIGLCIQNKVECGNKVCWRSSKAEKVGVTVSHKGRMTILEYSEVPPSLSDTEDASGKLLYGAGNICNHYLNVEFMITKLFPNLMESYHIAKKKIAYLDPVTRSTVTPTTNNGIKLEMFIFDVFPLADEWLVMEVDRRDEFAPVKNEPGAKDDSPDTARALLSMQAIRWLQHAGASVLDSLDRPIDLATFPKCLPEDSEYFCEISPLASYFGEGLEAFAGRTVKLPFRLNSI